MTTHSKIGASSMHRWSQCPGSVRLCADMPGTTSSYAEEGSDAHHYAALCLGSGAGPTIDDIGKMLKRGPRSFKVTREMFDAVKTYCDTLWLICNPVNDDKLHVETKFDLSEVHPGLFGTADAVIWQPKTKTLIVCDFKYGAGVAIGVDNNPQLMYYGLGALLAHNYPAEKVKFVIVQPRCDHPDGVVRAWEIPSIDIIDFQADLKQYALATEKPDAPLVPGDHCKFCPAARVCPALARRSQAIAKTEFSPVVPYDPKELALALDSLPVVEARVKAIREFAYTEAEQGRCPPGYKLVAKRPTRKWRSEGDVVEFLQDMAIPDELIFEPRSVRSPAQLEKEKAIGKGTLDEFIVSESSGHTLVHESDKRPAVKISAKEEFSMVT